MRMIYRNFSKRQILAMTWWNRAGLKHFDGIICDGAVRSGKTVCMTDGFFLWSMASFNGAVFGICGKTIASVRRNLVNNLHQWLGDVFTIREFRSENKLVVSNGMGHVNVYYLFGGQDESSCKLIQGITLAGVFLDEVALMPRSFVEQACARCSVLGSTFWFNCNPEGPEHWFYKEWIQKCAQKNLLRLHFTMEDNPGLDPTVRRRYESMYTGVFYRRYILGQWSMAEGLVYEFLPERHIAGQIPKEGKYYISVDYGTRNPFSAGLWCVEDDRAVRIREFYHSGRETGKMYTDQEYYRELEKLAGDLAVECVVVDPSAASFIAEIRSHGRFSVRKARNDVLAGIHLVAAMLKGGVLQIAPCCHSTIREFGIYRWEENGQADRPCKENDHAMDDIRYFCSTILRRNGRIRKKLGGIADEKMADRQVSAHLGEGNGSV